ncbi:LPS assembly lipoprotein LptE [Microbulbifer bruguierae]|uniref:LPS-assembly lipoprotein LptE n=1 Tax=Microbulbifer bruguierae TaxID=3029061 RepID=A0ABY8NIZ9_9GAMM|nr:LPS assembly lipoprotein LptE [Microbulbifer bruguierae]WGL17568.1 LPS assembly lipoprotein LptE [Microbulbifer bruguierae]
MLRTLILTLTVIISACGWHLRGAPKNFPPGSKLYITTEDPRSQLAESITRLLQTSGLPLAEDSTQADFTLTIHKETEQKRTVSVDAKGQASEYELITSAEYSVRDINGHDLLTNARADVYRTLVWDESEIVSKGEEERLQREEMRRELISRIIDRLRRIEISTPVTDNPATP